jgi:hypothetical protein
MIHPVAYRRPESLSEQKSANPEVDLRLNVMTQPGTSWEGDLAVERSQIFET